MYMNGQQVPAEVLVAFDIETGEVVHVQEWIVDRLLGNSRATRRERELLKREAACANPNRRIDVVAAPPMLRRPDEAWRYRVDPKTRRPLIERAPDVTLPYH